MCQFCPVFFFEVFFVVCCFCMLVFHWVLIWSWAEENVCCVLCRRFWWVAVCLVLLFRLFVHEWSFPCYWLHARCVLWEFVCCRWYCMYMFVIVYFCVYIIIVFLLGGLCMYCVLWIFMLSGMKKINPPPWAVVPLSLWIVCCVILCFVFVLCFGVWY